MKQYGLAAVAACIAVIGAVWAAWPEPAGDQVWAYQKLQPADYRLLHSDALGFVTAKAQEGFELHTRYAGVTSFEIRCKGVLVLDVENAPSRVLIRMPADARWRAPDIERLRISFERWLDLHQSREGCWWKVRGLRGLRRGLGALTGRCLMTSGVYLGRRTAIDENPPDRPSITRSHRKLSRQPRRLLVSPAPQAVPLPPCRSPEAFHSNFVRQASREVGIDTFTPILGISGCRFKKFAKQEQQKEGAVRCIGCLMFRPSRRPRTNRRNTELLVPKPAVVCNDVSRHAGDVQPVREDGGCQAHLSRNSLLLTGAKRLVEAGERPQRHDFRCHPNRYFGKRRCGVLVPVVPNERLPGARHFTLDAIQPICMLLPSEGQITRFQMAESAVRMREVVRENGPRCYLDMADGLHHQLSKPSIELIEAYRFFECRLIAEVVATGHTLCVEIAHETIVADTLQISIGISGIANGQPALLEEIQLLLNRQGWFAVVSHPDSNQQAKKKPANLSMSRTSASEAWRVCWVNFSAPFAHLQVNVCSSGEM